MAKINLEIFINIKRIQNSMVDEEKKDTQKKDDVDNIDWEDIENQQLERDLRDFPQDDIPEELSEEPQEMTAEDEEIDWQNTKDEIKDDFDSLPWVDEIMSLPEFDLVQAVIWKFDTPQEEDFKGTDTIGKVLNDYLPKLKNAKSEHEAKLKKEYEEREQEKLKSEKDFENVKTKQITSTEIREAQTEASKTEKYYFIDKFVKLAERKSFYNAGACKLAAHWTLSPFVKDIKLWKNDNSYIDPRIHCMHWQESQTGKNVLTRWASSFITKIIKEHDPSKLTQKKYVVEKIGSATSAGLITRKVLWKGKITEEDMMNLEPNEEFEGKYKKITGVIQYADLIYMEEAAPIFMSRSSEFTRDIPEILITCMEPIGTTSNVWRRKLKETDMSTSGNASLYLSTRPIDAKYHELIAGMTQRTLFFPRVVDEKTSHDMTNEALMNLHGDEKVAATLDERELDLIADLEKIKSFLKTNNNRIMVKPEERHDISAYEIKRFNEMFDLADREFFKSDKKMKLAHTLIRGDINQLYKLACHSAVVRYSKFIERQDIEYAISVLLLLFEAQVQFVDALIKEEMDIKIEKKEIKKYIKSILSLPKVKVTGIPRLSLRRMIEKECDISLASANYYINSNAGDNGIIKIDENGICRLNTD